MYPRAMLVPFGYPDYPRELLDRFLEGSKKALLANGLDLLTSSPVLVEEDVAQARRYLRQVDYDFLGDELVDPDQIGRLFDSLSSDISLVETSAIPLATALRQT